MSLERRLGETSPGIATAPDSPSGGGLTFFVFGLPPSTPVTYSISGVQVSRVNTRTTDINGFFYTYIDDSWTPGQYTMTAIWGSNSVNGTGRACEVPPPPGARERLRIERQVGTFTPVDPIEVRHGALGPVNGNAPALTVAAAFGPPLDTVTFTW